MIAATHTNWCGEWDSIPPKFTSKIRFFGDKWSKFSMVSSGIMLQHHLRLLSFLIKTITKPNQNNSMPPIINKNGNTTCANSMGGMR